MRLPVIFVGHGSPMIAIESNERTKTFKEIGEIITQKYSKPKAILSISAHWYTKGNRTQSEMNPKQIYDMYGFPKELYDVKYEPSGNEELTKRIEELLKDEVVIDDTWGIDHGSWSVYVHMFPKCDIPIVQLSVDGYGTEEDAFKVGEKLKVLRDEGFLIIGSGNIVHNLMMADWENKGGTKMSDAFDLYIKEAILNKEYEKVINHREHEFSKYAVPRLDHYLPLLYVLGASDNDDARVFNEGRELGSISNTSYIFGE